MLHSAACAAPLPGLVVLVEETVEVVLELVRRWEVVDLEFVELLLVELEDAVELEELLDVLDVDVVLLLELLLLVSVKEVEELV